jgi:transposase
MARPSKLTPEIEKKICDFIKAGNTPETAALISGISRATFFNWMKKGREAKRKNQFLDFLDSIKKAEKYSEAWHVQNIRNASEDKWQASAWFLERRYPGTWAKWEHRKLEHSGKIDSDVVTTEVSVHDRIKEYEKRFGAVRKGDNSSDDL